MSVKIQLSTVHRLDFSIQFVVKRVKTNALQSNWPTKRFT